ncbi:MAG: N-6 DNA methylase [Pseudomonadota bacterium]
MAKRQPQSDIFQVLDLLQRETPLPNEKIIMILAALIYLRWADFQEAEQEAMAAFDETDFKPLLPASLHWRSWHLLPPDQLQDLFRKQLPDVLDQLNNTRHISLATHLHRIASPVRDLGNLSLKAMEVLIHWLADQPFETPLDRRALLDSFDAVFEQTRGKISGGYRTPASVAQLLIALADPAAGDRVYDPCCGSAGLLTAANDYAGSKVTEQFSRSGFPALSISGFEINLESYITGLVRLALAGVDDPQIELGNSLERLPSRSPQKDGFDVVLANPPWGMRVDPMVMAHFSVRTHDATGLYIQHALTQLRENGRAVIVVPQGILFRGGQEQRLRRMLLEQHTVEAVVALPQGLFMPYSGIQASVLVLRKTGPTKSIRMIDAEPFFEKDKSGRPTVLTPSQTEAIGKLFRGTEPGEHCWNVDPATLADAGWDLTPKRRDRSRLVDILDALRSEVEIVSLGKYVEIFVGRNFLREKLSNTPPYSERDVGQRTLFPEETQSRQLSLFDVPVVPYVRIKDVERGQATKGSSWLSRNAAGLIDVRWKLKAGDVLLSKSGTIGKAGIVRNGAVGAIAAGGLFVLRPAPDRLDPHFLLAYLVSGEARSWLEDKGRGATIRHLSRRAIDELPIPVPPIQMQHRVAAQYREFGTDALEFLKNLVSGGERDSILQWTREQLQKFSNEWSTKPDRIDFSSLERFVSELNQFRNRDAHQWEGKNRLSRWLFALHDALSQLNGISKVPAGTAVWSLLSESCHRVSEVRNTLQQEEPGAVEATELSSLVFKWLEHGKWILAHDIKLVFTPEENPIHAGAEAEVHLVLENKGALPLRNITIRTNPEWGIEEVPYISEEDMTIIRFSGHTPKDRGTFILQLHWSAQTLDGQDVNGMREVAFNIVGLPDDTEEKWSAFGGSPYVCGDPVRPERSDVFFGREELLNQIRRQIIQSGNVVLLEGNRRSGKTSILCHLEGAKAIPGWLGVYCSLQGAEGSKDGVGVPTAEVFREMGKSIAKSIHTMGGDTPLPDGSILPAGKKMGFHQACRKGIGEESPFSDFRDYIEVALEKLAAHDMGLLLMMDEFDKLQEGIDSGVTSKQVPENIRFLVQTYPRFSAILTGSRRLKRLREEYWSALYGLGTRFGVTALPEEPARRLVVEPVKGRLTYTTEAVNRVIQLTAGQPYLLQCLCNRVFDMAAQLKKRSITIDMVNQAGDALVEDNEHFASLWDYALSDRRRLILAICHKNEPASDPLRLGVIQETLAGYGIEADDETIISDLEFLRELELIELKGDPTGGQYLLSIPLMGTWIERQHDFSALISKARMETEDQHG